MCLAFKCLKTHMSYHSVVQCSGRFNLLMVDVKRFINLFTQTSIQRSSFTFEKNLKVSNICSSTSQSILSKLHHLKPSFPEKLEVNLIYLRPAEICSAVKP